MVSQLLFREYCRTVDQYCIRSWKVLFLHVNDILYLKFPSESRDVLRFLCLFQLYVGTRHCTQQKQKLKLMHMS